MLSSNNSVLSNFFTLEFLIFSCNDLKNNSKMQLEFRNYKFYYPISRFWFERTSFLIRSGSFSYKNFSVLKVKNIDRFRNFSISFFKAKIIENAFLLLIRPYFFNSFFFKSFNLTECLRIF